MKLTAEFQSLEKSRARLTVTVAQKDVSDAYGAVVAKYVKNAQIPGFRKGHVPQSVLERKFGESIKAEALGEVVDKSLGEALQDDKQKDARPLPYSQPVMDSMPAFDLSKDLSYTVTYDVFPKVEVTDFSGIEIKEPQVEIGEEELSEELRAVQERNALAMDKKDGEAAEKGDIVTVDYCECAEDGSEIEYTKRQGFAFTVGQGQTLYKIDDDVVGMKKGDEKKTQKTFPKDFPDKDLAGRTKTISVKVTSIKTRDLPALDDELAQDVNESYKTLDDLKDAIKRNLQAARDRRIGEIKSASLLSQLIAKNKFDIPESMLRAELDGRWSMMARQFKTTPEQLERVTEASGQTKEELLKSWEAESEGMLKSRVIVESLLKSRGVSVTPEEVEAEYERIADENGVSSDEVKRRYADAQAKEYLIDEVKERKLYDELYKEVKVRKGEKMTLKELFASKAEGK